MTFNAAIPQSTDFLSVSQPQILTNFSQVNTLFAIDHVNFTNATVADRGKHIVIHSKRDLFAAAQPTTLADEGAIYTKEAVGAGRVEAYYRYPGNGAVSQLTFIKAWVRFDGTPGGGPAITDSYNVATVTRPGVAGRYVITFTTALSNANYMVIPIAYSGFLGFSGVTCNAYNFAVGSFNLDIVSLINQPIVNVVVIGS